MMTDAELRALLKRLKAEDRISLKRYSLALKNPRSGQPYNHAYLQQYVERKIPVRLEPNVRRDLIDRLTADGLLPHQQKDEPHTTPGLREPATPFAGGGDIMTPSISEGESDMEKERQAVITLIRQLDRAGLQHIHMAAKAQLTLQEKELGRLISPLVERAGR